MKILFIGPQGSGKSTQAKMLAEYLNIPYLGMGDIFRSISGEESSEGERIKRILEAGNLVDDKTAAKLITKRLKGSLFERGFILDGFPRNLEQLALFDPNFDMVFYLNVLKEELIKRLLSRGRLDDTEQSIATRLDNYFKQTEPLLSFYKQKGILKEVNGKGSIEEIQQKIRSHFS